MTEFRYVYNISDIYAVMEELIRIPVKKVYDTKMKQYYIAVGCGFDIETTAIYDNAFNPVCAFCYNWQFSFGNLVIMGRNPEIFIDFLSILQKYIATYNDGKKTVRLLVLDANLGFEWQFFKKLFNRLGITEFFCKEPRNPLKFVVGNCFEFREILGLFGKSLSDVAEHYTKTQKLKGDLDYNKIRHYNTVMTKKEIQYCINDVVILSELGEYIFSNFFGRCDSLPFTATGFIRNAIKKRIGRGMQKVRTETVQNLPCQADYVNFRNYLYKGGLCGTNARYTGKILENVVCVDLTSDYPAQMLHRVFPCGKCVETEPENFAKKSNVPYIGLIAIYGMQAKTTHSILSSSKVLNFNTIDKRDITVDNGRIFSCRCQTEERNPYILVYLNEIELKDLKKVYKWDKLVCLKCWCFERYGKIPSYLYETVIEKYRDKAILKQKIKALEDAHKTVPDEMQLEYKKLKEFVNGIYGMCATSVFTDEKYIDFEDDNLPVKIQVNAKTWEKATKNMFLSPFIAFWVTTYARGILIDFISKFPNKIVQYDTDSLYFIQDSDMMQAVNAYNDDIFRKNRILFQNDKMMEDIGSWDVECIYKRFKGLGSKRYIVEKPDGTIKVTIAGCRKKALVEQLSDKNKHSETKIDVFDFFKDGMTIDRCHTQKLSSLYIDDETTVEVFDGVTSEKITVPSCTVLVPIDFRLGMHDYSDFLKTRLTLYKNHGIVL